MELLWISVILLVSHDYLLEGWDAGCQNDSHQTYDLIQIKLTSIHIE
jgi:hypothetical protein